MSSILLPGKRKGIIKDPVHDFIPITEIEKEVIDTLPVQRLRRIKQLAGVEFVYPGGIHTRLEHVFGAMHLAGLLSSELSQSKEIDLNNDMIQLLRLAGLLHDVGHGPFSHVFEGILEQQDRTHEDFSSLIIRESEICEVLERNDIDVELLSTLAIGKCKTIDPPVLNQIIATSAVDVDKLDFIGRDSFHTGAYYGYIDISRLIYRIGVIDDNLAVDISALSVLESFIIARLMSFKNVYFHRVSRAVQIMLLEAMWRSNQQHILEVTDLENYLALDDIQVWATLRNTETSKEIMQRIERRDLLKTAYEREFRSQDHFVTQLLTAQTVREKLITEIAEIADVSVSQVYIDVPTVPSVPYSSHLAEPYDIPLMSRQKYDDSRTKLTLRQYSPVIDILRGILSIVRIYTLKEHRERVRKAAEQIFGEPTYTSKISM